VVWDYTQDFRHRPEWDPAVAVAEVVQEAPARLVRVRMRDGGHYTVQYKLFDRPRRTSLALVEVASRWLVGGGGSWAYELVDGGTAWTQTNTLVLRPLPRAALLQPLVARHLRSATRRAMWLAKARIVAGRMARTAGQPCPATCARAPATGRCVSRGIHRMWTALPSLLPIGGCPWSMSSPAWSAAPIGDA